MQSSTDTNAELVRPVDDGGADHLVGMAMPHITLPATTGETVDLGAGAHGWTVIFCYPRTGRPDTALPEGWEKIPGAIGCTPQACSFRDRYADLRSLDATIYGVSTQTTEYQAEMAMRLGLRYAVLSDAKLAFANALRLPTFESEGETLLKRLTLIVKGGVIRQVFYPVFPPEENAAEVQRWLEEH